MKTWVGFVYITVYIIYKSVNKIKIYFLLICVE